MTPSPRVAAYAVACVLILVGILAVLSFINDPFGIRSWFANREKARVERVESDLSARTTESEGRAGQLDRLESFHREIITIQSATASAETEARRAPDASTPLDLARADRLRRADDSLCQHVACRHAPKADDPA